MKHFKIQISVSFEDPLYIVIPYLIKNSATTECSTTLKFKFFSLPETKLGTDSFLIRHFKCRGKNRNSLLFLEVVHVNVEINHFGTIFIFSIVIAGSFFKKKIKNFIVILKDKVPP